MIESASNTSRRRRQVWLACMRQRDACWAGEVTLKGSRIVSEPAHCGQACNSKTPTTADVDVSVQLSIGDIEPVELIMQ